MKLRFLLSLLFIGSLGGLLKAQVVCDYPEWVNNKLIISEIRATSNSEAYVEITNLDSKPIQLSEYKLGSLTVWVRTSQIFDLCNDPWYTGSFDYIFLPDRVLDPGKSFVITNAYDYGPRHYKKYKGRLGGSERPKQIGIYEVADKLIHMEEKINGIYYEGDSITTAHNDPENITPRGDVSVLFSQLVGGTFYLEQFNAVGDSAIVDQVGGVFGNNGRNFESVSVDVAGVEGGMSNSVVVRKATVANGNIDFANGRGVALEDSEWIPIPYPTGYNAWRDIFWTIGNHGAYVLDENTLEPANDNISVDFASKTITVPYGTMRLDDIMRGMKKKPGVAWQYDLNPIQSDSLYRSARTGDQLTVFVVGNTLQRATFNVVVKEPTADDNFIMPKDYSTIRAVGLTGPITTRTQNGIMAWPRITNHEHGNDTISGSGFGLEFDLRTDSLLKRLEIPPKATWEFVWVDGSVRADLKDGDKLKVTSESGKVKEYYIQVQPHRPNNNADLASITWPDIPEFYRGFFGWKGDTIPNFSPGSTMYQVEVPFDVEGIPALKAKTSNVNATVKVTRAKSLIGTSEDRSVIFEVTAEDDTIIKKYHVEFVKEIRADQIEPYIAEPFFSEFINSYPAANIFLEIFNPGNQPLDLRDYMIGLAVNADPYRPIIFVPAWSYRYSTYIPGLKHVDQATWAISPKYMVPDPSVNPIIQGRGTFVMAVNYRGDDWYAGVEAAWPKWDVQFAPETVPGVPNNWNENVTYNGNQGAPMPVNGNRSNFFALYKILNDSIKRGLKAIGDVNDFEIVDMWGMADRQPWVVGGVVQSTNQTKDMYIRKPYVTKGNPEWGGSFGTNLDDTEWDRIVPDIDYNYLPAGTQRYAAAYSNIGHHYFIEPSFYKSTVNSSQYRVSDGFGPDQKIEGIKKGVTVAEFLANINKEDEGQTLKIISAVDGSEMDLGAALTMNDKLVSVSADESNTTIYRLDVTEIGFSNNAYLTSTRWDIQVTADPKSSVEAADEEGTGVISGFDYGTPVKTIVDNVNVPAGAILTVIDGSGAYVPFTTLNFDAVYVSVTVNPDTYLDVVAEDNVTRMVYQLQPNTSESDAFILSDVYEVSQIDNLIHHVPRGTNFDAFLNNIIPSLGASLKLVDKLGFERKYGNIREDDKVVVTSANGEIIRVYFISFRPTTSIPETLYLAYVLSEAYGVDQVSYKISEGLAELTGQTLVDEFMSYIIPSMGATVAIIDKNGDEKNSGDLDDGDVLKVTSANGKLVTIYTLDLDLTSADQISIGSSIEFYPNPADAELRITGINAGNTIQVFSATGSLLLTNKAIGDYHNISLDNVPSGMFMIVISDGNRPVGRFKAIKR